MKIDRKRIGNRCGYDQNECMRLAKRLAACSDAKFLKQLRKIKVWSYGKCELGLWADVLDRLDAILEDVTTIVGSWTLKVDLPGNEHLVKDVVTVLEFTGHLIEHSIYRCLYGSWNHILTLFGSSNMDILLAVLGLAYNFSKRSNYFTRLDSHNKSMILDRLVSIAESWGGAENQFDLASCCLSDHFPPSAGKICFEYHPEPEQGVQQSILHTSELRFLGSSATRTILPCVSIIEKDLTSCKSSPSEIMESLLQKYKISTSKQMALFARIRLAVYFMDHDKRMKCIKARLQAISTLCYTFEFDDRLLYFGLMDELIEVLQLPDGEFMEIKACALRTMTAVFNLHRVNVNLVSILESTGMSSFHGALPTRIRRWIQCLVDGTCDATGGSVNQQYTIALLSFLYHLAAFEENVGPTHTQGSLMTMRSSGILDSMLQLIAWHVPRDDTLSYVTRAVRVTDQILTSAVSNRQVVVTRLVERLGYEKDLVIMCQSVEAAKTDDEPTILNTQRSGLMKSILNLLKRLCLDNEWSEAMRVAMEGTLPEVLQEIYQSPVFQMTPHLPLFAMETVTNYIYTYPSTLSYMQDKGVTHGIIAALAQQPLPQSRDFLVHLPSILITLALNARGRSALCTSGILDKYLETLISPVYLTTMKAKRVRDLLSQISYNLSSASGQVLSNNLTASQMSNSIQELLRARIELKPLIFSSLVKCFKKVVDLGNSRPAVIHACPRLANEVPQAPSGSTCSADSPNVPARPHSPAAISAPRTRINGAAHHARRSSGRPTSARVIIGSNEVGRRHALEMGLAVGLEAGVDDEDDVQVMDDDEDEEDVEMEDVDVDDNVMMFSGSDDASSDADVGDDGAENDHSALTENLRRMQHSTPDDKPPSQSPQSSSASVSKGVDVEEQDEDATQYTAEYILNLCKFLERLLPSMLHVSDSMCRQFLNQGGVRILCDLLTMQGLPYDFPISAACASICKIFEQLVSYLPIDEVLPPLLQALDGSIEKAKRLWGTLASSGRPEPQMQPRSLLLEEALADRSQFLHELVIVSSIVCVIVHVVNHLKADLRFQFANIWISQDHISDLSELYLNILWDSSLLLASVCAKEGDGMSQTDVGDDDQLGPPPQMPPFVETMSLYRILKPSVTKPFFRLDGCTLGNKHRVFHMVCITSFLINSISELCTTMTRFCLVAPSNVTRRLVVPTNHHEDPLPYADKIIILSRVASLAVDGLRWTPPSTTSSVVVPEHVLHAMRYAGVRLAHLLLFDATTNTPHLIMLNLFYMLRGIDSVVEVLNDVVGVITSEKLTSMTSVSVVLEELLACVDRLTCMPGVRLTNLSAGPPGDANHNDFDYDSFFKYMHTLTLAPLERFCSHGSLPDQMTERATEHLLSLLINVAPYMCRKNNAEEQEIDRTSDSQPPPTTYVPAGQHTTMENHQAEVPEDRIRSLEAMGFGRTDAVGALRATSGNVNEAASRLFSYLGNGMGSFMAPRPSPNGVGPPVSQQNPTTTGPIDHRPHPLIPTQPTPLPQPQPTTAVVTTYSPIVVPSDAMPSLLPMPLLTTPMTFPRYKKPNNALPDPFSEQVLAEHRDLLRKHIFPICFEIAKAHRSAEVFHQISELILCSKEEVSCIRSLVKAALPPPEVGVPNFDPNCNEEDRGSMPLDMEVALHILALLFTRCRFLCAQLVHARGLHTRLTTYLASEIWHDRRHESLVTLAALVLDQYERAVGAMKLRQKAIQLYKGQHRWMFLDEHNNEWIDEERSNTHSIDEAFHNGATRLYWDPTVAHTSQRHLTYRRGVHVEFPRMCQRFADLPVPRNILLLPNLPPFVGPNKDVPMDNQASSSETEQGTGYERMVLLLRTPEGLSPDHRKNLCLALVNKLKAGVVDHECANALLRLLLRLASTSHADVETLLQANILDVLCNFNHPKSFTGMYTSFVNHVVRQLMDDEETATATIKQIIVGFVGGQLSLSPHGCRDLFLMSLLAIPLVVKNAEIATRLLQESAILDIDQQSIQEGKPPLRFTVTRPADKFPDEAPLAELNERQKQIVGFLVNRLANAPLTPSSRDIYPTPVDAVSPARGGACDESGQLTKADFLRILVNLSMASRGVTEFLCHFTLSSGGTFPAYLFAHTLHDPPTMDQTILLLQTIMFVSSRTVQSTMLNEFKASLKAVIGDGCACGGGPQVDGVMKNQMIISHVRFLDCLLVLPNSILPQIIRQIYKKQIGCDVAKLIATVQCNVHNTSQALVAVVKALEYLTWLDKEIQKRVTVNNSDLGGGSRNIDMRTPQENHVSVVTTVADDVMHTATEMTQPLASSVAPSVVESSITTMRVAPPAPTSQTQHLTDESDTWALAEGISEMEDTTVEDSNAILILDESGGIDDVEDVRGGVGGAGSVGDDDTDGGHDDDGEGGGHIGDGSYAADTSYHSNAEEEEDDDGVSEEDDGGALENELDDDEADEEVHHFTSDLVHELATSTLPMDSTLTRMESAGLMSSLMSNVLNAVESPRDPILLGIPAYNPRPPRRNGFDRNFVLHFASVGSHMSDDFVSNWGTTSGRNPLQDLQQSAPRLDTALNESLNSSTNSEVANIPIPSQHPLLQVPMTQDLVVDRSGTPGLYPRTGLDSFLPMNFPRTRGPPGGMQSAVVTVLPSSGHAPAAGGRVSGGINTNQVGGAPLMLRTGQPLMPPPLPPAGPMIAYQPNTAGGRVSRRRLVISRNFHPQMTGANTGLPPLMPSNRQPPAEVSEQDADGFIWEMLTSWSTYRAATISDLISNNRGPVSNRHPGSSVFTMLNNYRRLIDVARILHGQELMDLLLIVRHEVGCEAVRRRNESFAEQLLTYEEAHTRIEREIEEQAEINESEETANGGNGDHRRVEEDDAPREQGATGTTNYPMNLLDEQRSHHMAGDVTQAHEGVSSASAVPAPEAQAEEVPEVSRSAESEGFDHVSPLQTPDAHHASPAAPTPPQSSEIVVPSVSTPTSAAQTHVPVTDDETIACMVSEGMDPSFLDALPEDVRRELIADHRRTRELRSQLSSMQANLPEHVDADFLASLPQNIQEEVLAQVRQEAVANSAPANNSGAAQAVDAANRSSMVPTTSQGDASNNSAFLTSLPASLRHEILADMVDFQMDLLPEEMQSEARIVRTRTMEREQRQRNATRHGTTTDVGRFTNAIDSAVATSRALSDLFRTRFEPSGGGGGRWDRTVYFGGGGAGGGSSRGNGGLTASTLQGLQTFFTSNAGPRNNALIDNEGLTCILAVLVASSSNRNLQKNTVPVLQRVLHNLCEHPPVHMWITSTVISLIKALSEKPLSTSQTAARNLNTSVASSGSIFGAGFEAALGCVVRIFHPLPDGTYTIHPQAASIVCSTLLDTISDLARGSKLFYPRHPSVSSSSSSTSESAEPKTDFWEILARLGNGSKQTPGSGPRRSLVRFGELVVPSGPDASAFPSEDTDHQSSNRGPSNSATNGGDGLHSSHEDGIAASCPSSSSVEYFSHLLNFLLHPVIASQPYLLEKLLNLLVSIVQHYFQENMPDLMEPAPNQNTNTANQSGGSSSNIQPSVDPTGPGPNRSSTSTDAPRLRPAELMSPLCQEVTECLCNFVIARKSNKKLSTLAGGLIILLSRGNDTTKAIIRRTMEHAITDLTHTITAQLSAVIEEVNSLPPSSRRPSVVSIGPPIPHSASMTRLPGDVGSALTAESVGSSVDVGATSAIASPPSVPQTGGELELASLQPLAASQSDQARFCCLVRLMNHLISPGEVVPTPIEGVNTVWDGLSATMESLQENGDINSSLLLEPLVEALCLTHSKPTSTATYMRLSLPHPRRPRTFLWGGAGLPDNSTMASRIRDMVYYTPPTPDLFVAESQPIEPLAPLSPESQVDLNRPMSPLLDNVDYSSSERSALPDQSELPTSANQATETGFQLSQFFTKHRATINIMLRRYSGSLADSPFHVLLAYPMALDFDVKRRFFRQRCQSLGAQFESLRRDDETVVVTRERIFEDSYARLHRKEPEIWRRKFVIRFQSEEGQDAGGLLREWYLLMSREVFNPNYCLFRVSPADRVTYTINPASFVNSNHLSYFKFVGRFIAKAIFDNKLLECYFTRSFYKHILGRRLRFRDLESEDYDFYKGLEYLLQHDVSEMGYEITFCTEINEFGRNQTRNLIENGNNIVVTEANKHEYVRLVCQERMTGAIRQQLDAFLEGFYDIIPKHVISLFNEQELELLISGLPNIDIDDLKVNTTYSKYQPSSPQIQWFWQALESFEQEDRARFLQFVTGTSKVPLGGFVNLEGMHGPTRFQIIRASVSSQNHLPSAHTCFNTLELPPYESYDQLRERLLTAIRECCEGYGMA